VITTAELEPNRENQWAGDRRASSRPTSRWSGSARQVACETQDADRDGGCLHRPAPGASARRERRQAGLLGPSAPIFFHHKLARGCHPRKPSPKCLHDPGRLPKTGGDSRGRRGARKQLESEHLAPEVARHHQLRETLQKGSSPVDPAISRRPRPGDRRSDRQASLFHRKLPTIVPPAFEITQPQGDFHFRPPAIWSRRQCIRPAGKGT
jgi:hypothetical protein